MLHEHSDERKRHTRPCVRRAHEVVSLRCIWGRGGVVGGKISAVFCLPFVLTFILFSNLKRKKNTISAPFHLRRKSFAFSFLSRLAVQYPHHSPSNLRSSPSVLSLPPPHFPNN